MQLTLSVLRCPPAVTPETRTLTGGEYTIGRGPGVDWVLADVSRVVSRRHCTLAFRSGDWHIIDDSLHGTFPNNDDEPIGKGNDRILRDHDRVRIGPYEIEVMLMPEGAARPGHAGGYVSSLPDRFYDDDPYPGSGGLFGGDFTQGDHSPPEFDAMPPPREAELTTPAPGPIPADTLLPDGWEKDLLDDLAGFGTPVTPVTPAKPPSEPPPAMPDPPRQPVSERPVQAAAHDDASLLAAFLAGAGFPDARLADPVATMRRLGETYRAMAAGLRAVLIARASIKSEFRIEQTMIQARGNNPLKFSANDDDATAALLGVGRHTDMPPAKAVHDALRDVRLHELASMAAMQSAVRALLSSLGPDKVRASVEFGGGMSLLPSQSKARAWDAYEALHARIAQALSDDFESVFGKAFARAYEDAFDDLTARDRS